MKIELKEIPIRDVAKNYVDNEEDGVIGYDGTLNIRPKYQREFIYDDKKRNAVIDSVLNGFPLNVMYWVVNGKSAFEILDGQQRTVSICRYVAGDYSVVIDGMPKTFHNLTKVDKDKILDYKVLVYFCEGTDKEIISWFKIINIAGEKLTDQELRNAVYTGPWLSHAKSIFSKTNCAAYNLSKDYVKGVPIRQELLQTAIDWIAGGDIEGYMSAHQNDPNANELWTYFQNVINWVQLTFPNYRKEMKGIDWASLYNEFHKTTYDTTTLEEEITKLMMDDDVNNKRGIYSYVLTRNEKHLSIRAFSEAQKRAAYEKQKGICKKCGNPFKLKEMEADHITPWSKGGKTMPENCQMLCKGCNRRKSDT